MVFDIPNYFTLAIEIAVAIMILWVEQRSRRREAASLKRGYEMEQKHRETQQLQMERFSSWIKEDSRRQLMMLDPIMVTLDAEKASIFRNEVGQRYTDEITRDLNDLEELLEQKQEIGLEKNPALDNTISQKIDELSSAEEIASSFLPRGIAESLKSISNISKATMIDLGDLSNLSSDLREIGEPHHGKLPPEPKSKLTEDKEKLSKEIENLKLEIGKTIAESTSHLGEKLQNILDPSKINKGIMKFVSKIGTKKTESANEKDED
ncbi:MAG: hypothetical protein HeimC2_04760 [Candidatus Heimdallarchaeota archaeon LC_2]|nr:MAG: hypothetical protein HeimC2_04760 [Candidatus Heimdallarchaeota archaeon LC_2]